MGKMIFLSFMDIKSVYTMRQIERLAGIKNRSDITEAIEGRMIIQCGKNSFGDTLYKLTNKGKLFSNS